MHRDDEGNLVADTPLDHMMLDQAADLMYLETVLDRCRGCLLNYTKTFRRKRYSSYVAEIKDLAMKLTDLGDI